MAFLLDADLHQKLPHGAPGTPVPRRRQVAGHQLVGGTRPGIAGCTCTLTGPEAVAYPELAARLAALTGSVVRYVKLAPDELRDSRIRNAHMPAWLAEHVTEIQ
ncbi:hypothetical protein ACIQV3_32810 [Streptomyces sp. NPDC099050]|uniref:hypothetical protein n=1 Tax=Streptomyces sp. NPDC099050 TaxID=3366100 RepID=UPI003806F5F2